MPLVFSPRSYVLGRRSFRYLRHPAQLERAQLPQPPAPATDFESPFGEPLRPKNLDTSRRVFPEPQPEHFGSGPSLRRDIRTSNLVWHFRH